MHYAFRIMINTVYYERRKTFRKRSLFVAIVTTFVSCPRLEVCDSVYLQFTYYLPGSKLFIIPYQHMVQPLMCTSHIIYTFTTIHSLQYKRRK